MPVLAALLVFVITGASADDEHGEVHARSCAEALAYVQKDIRPGQTLTVISCNEGAR